MMSALFAVMALALDGGMMLTERRHAQGTADAAALAAGADLFKNYLKNKGVDTGGTAAGRATAIAKANGYGNDATSAHAADTSTVTVSIPPVSGSFVGKAGYAEVVVQYNQRRHFSSMWGSNAIPISARAVARGQWVPGTNGFLVLAPSGTSVTMTGNANVNVQNGTFVVNSTGPNAYNGGKVKSVASEFDFLASQTNSGLGANPSQYVSGPGGASPTIAYNQPQVTDPLAFLPQPSSSGMTVRSSSALNITGGSGSTTLSPGLYTGGISVTGNSTNVTLNPGVYYLNGPFTWNSGGTLDGTSGVLIYVVPGGATDGIKITNGTIDLKPMTTGIYQGISLYQDRTSTSQVTLTGGSAWDLEGTIYAAGAPVKLDGGASGTDTRGSQYIVNTVTLTGSATVDVNAGSAKAGQTRLFQLVE